MAEILDLDFSADPARIRGILQRIQSELSRGGVIAFPTDTFYGLGANPFNEVALREIFRVKNRPPEKPILVLIAETAQLRQLTGEPGAAAQKLINACWPGPLTLLFDALPHLPPMLTAGTGKIGVRLPGHDYSRELIRRLGHPLTATSANLSGGNSLPTSAEVEKELGGRLRIILSGQCSGGGESSIVDTTATPPRLVRAGAMPREKIESALGLSLL